jgi:hypothetical protein
MKENKRTKITRECQMLLIRTEKYELCLWLDDILQAAYKFKKWRLHYLPEQALKYRSVTDIVRPIRQIVRRREETTGHSVRPKWNWDILFVRPEWIGVRPKCSFVRRFLHARKSKCTLCRTRGSYMFLWRIRVLYKNELEMFLIMSPSLGRRAKWWSGKRKVVEVVLLHWQAS